MTSIERERVERRLAAILMADVAGYSRLMGADEEGTHAALTTLRREVTAPEIAKHRGRIVKTTGDSLLVEFASVVDAVRKLGNSAGVIIPKSLLRDLGIAEGDPVEMILEGGRIVLVPIKPRARAGWAEASRSIAEAHDDVLVW